MARRMLLGGVALLLAVAACRTPVAAPTVTPTPAPAPATEAPAVTPVPSPQPPAAQEATPTATPTTPQPTSPTPSPTPSVAPTATPAPLPTPTPRPKPTPTPKPTLSESEIVARLKETVVRLVTPAGQGSGVIFDPRGFVLTANHVVSGSAQVTAVFADGKRERALILGRDEFRDLAVIKVSGREDLVAAPIGDSAALFAGDRVLAMGYTGESLVTTQGIVSDRVVLGGLTLIQTDTLLIPGFSGGPLFTPQGEVIGLSVQGIPGAATGGLAIALDSVQSFIPRLMAGELFLVTPPPQTGASRQNPAPIGTTVRVTGFSISGLPTLHEMTVLESMRGDAAMAKLGEVSSFVLPPAPGEDYIVLKLRVKYAQGPDDETVRVSWVYFDLFSSEGFSYVPAFSVVPPDPLLAFDFLPGSQVDAWLVYVLNAADKRPLLSYGINWFSRGKGWFQVMPAKTKAPPPSPTPQQGQQPTPSP